MYNIMNRIDDAGHSFDQHWNKLINSFFHNSSISSLKNKVLNDSGFPKLDVFYTKDNYVIESMVPCDETDVSVEMKEDGDNRYVVISGQMSKQYEQNDVEFVTRELRRSKFSRTVMLPPSIKTDPEAVMKDGVLTIKWELPKETIVPPVDDKKMIPIKRE